MRVKSEKSKPVVLLHALNGTGTGHLSRQVALARHLRSHGKALATVVVSESPAAADLCDGIPFLPIPSTHALRELARTDPFADELVRCKIAMCTTVIESLRPTLVIHDTMVWAPLFAATAMFGARQALCLRPRRDIETYLADPNCPAKKMDLVFVPDDLSRYPQFGTALLSSGIDAMWTGPITRPRQKDRDAVRDDLSLSLADRLVVITTGGGAGPDAREFAERSLEACAKIDLKSLAVVLVLGPLMKGSVRIPQHFRHGLYIQRVNPHMQDLLASADAIVCRGGYGSLNEGVRGNASIFAYPSVRRIDDQEQRVRVTAREEMNVSPGADGHIDTLPDMLTAALRRTAKKDRRTSVGDIKELVAKLNALALSPTQYTPGLDGKSYC